MTPLNIGSDRTPVVTRDSYYKFTENTSKSKYLERKAS